MKHWILQGNEGKESGLYDIVFGHIIETSECSFKQNFCGDIYSTSEL